MQRHAGIDLGRSVYNYLTTRRTPADSTNVPYSCAIRKTERVMIEIKVRELGGVHRVLVVRTEWRSRPKVVFYEDTKTAHAATTRAAALKVLYVHE